MSVLLGNGTLANLNTAYYSGGGGGGGGPNLVVSTITSDTAAVSSITAIGGGGGLNLVGDSTGINLDGGSGGVFVNGPGLFFPDEGNLAFQSNNGEITGLSSINGAAYPPPGAAAPVSTIVNGGATIGSVPVNLVPAGPTLSTGKCYMFNVSLDSPSNAVIGAPSVGDHVGFVLPDTSVPFTIDLVQLSTIRAAGQPFGFSFAAPFVAGAGAFNFSAYCNANATASTFVGASGPAWITPLN